MKKRNILTAVLVLTVVIIIALVVIIINGAKEENKEGSTVEIISDDYLTFENESFTASTWPEKFSHVPEFKADSFEELDGENTVTLIFSEGDYKSLDKYEESLKKSGYEKYLDDDLTVIYGKDKTEIQIIEDENAPRITLSEEETLKPPYEGFELYPLPSEGRIISYRVSEEFNNVMYLNYRNLNYTDALSFCKGLTDVGWTELSFSENGELRPFIAEYTKGSMTITIDFHCGSSELTVILGNVNNGETPDFGEDELKHDEETGEYYILDEDGNRINVDYRDTLTDMQFGANEAEPRG